ncbi:double-stranded RNA-binding protein Staufen homolog 2 isoform X2 [Strongylocentrotus purpuratus]|uniref:DRBM domain-containing protein n=1 Tax=Strongylocentrotus purpuratus TaxID=7668 RepID=A0A7M7N1K7_STRPU|nr:double-stranded RNA-binding protein Staufen homolog 2 isoform X2 [Strongylocentrotus purpuratus]
MSTPMSHSANQSAAPAVATSSPSEAHPTGRPAGILPMPAQLLAASHGGGGGGGGGPPAASASASPKGTQQDSNGGVAVPSTGGGDNAAQGPAQNEANNMANTKEKTSMCLLNELARFNKLQPKYELVSEKGPPHEKIFSVCLTLGTQKYDSSGASIKKAQHGAAASALEKCGLPHPVPRNQPKKFKHRPMNTNTDAMTPTVKLNSLAMKTGKQVHYMPLNPVPQRPFYGGYRGPRNQGMPPPNHGGMPQGPPPQGPHPNQQQPPSPPQQPPAAQQQGQGQQGQSGPAQPPPTFHPPGPPQMPPPPLQPQQGQVAPPPGMAPPQGMPPQGPGGMEQQGQQDGAPPPNQTQQQHQHMPQQGGPPYQNNHNRPYYRYPRPFVHYIKVTVGDHEFVGEGKTQKGARQNAAFRALTALENEPASKVDMATTTNVVVDGNGDAPSGGEERNVKSDISLIYEAANLHNLNVVFKVLDERGQPHLKIFKLQCTVGEFNTESEGPSKKDAKRKAAELMLPKLKELPPVAAKVVIQHHMMQRKLWVQDKNKKRKSKSLLKTSPEDPNFGAPGLHPVSRLVQILQAKNEREPEFAVTEERPLMERAGAHMIRRREFTMQVSAASKTASGKGKTKKDAKKQAAENMLKLLGYAPTPEESNGVGAGQPSKSALKTGSKTLDQEGDRKVTFKDEKQKKGLKKDEKKDGSPAQVNSVKGLAPGLLPMMPGMGSQPSQIFPSGPAPAGAHKMPGQGLNRAPGAPVTGSNMKVSPKKNSLRDIAQDLLSLGHSPTAEALLKGTSGPHSIPNLSRPTQQLEYLAQVGGVSTKFNDFPKGNKPEYQSVVYISTEPQSAYRGVGATLEAAHDVAAITALRSLAGITDGGDANKNGSGR